MTTKSIRPVTRESSAWVRDKGMRPLIVTVIGGVVELRPKGLRTTEVLDLASIYLMAVRQRVARERIERLRLRRARKGRG